eukprot:1510336-Amphidinium_carterae.1
MVFISSGPGFAGNLCLCNGSRTKRKLWQVLRARRLLPVQITTPDDSCVRIASARLGAPCNKLLSPSSVGHYGAEVGGILVQHMKDLRRAVRCALGKGAALRLFAACRGRGPVRNLRMMQLLGLT